MNTSDDKTRDDDTQLEFMFPVPNVPQSQDNVPMGWDNILEDVRIYPKGSVPPPQEPMVIDSDNPSMDEDDISDLGEYTWLEKYN